MINILNKAWRMEKLTRVRRRWHGYWAAKHAEELVIAEAELLHEEIETKAAMQSRYAYGENVVWLAIRRHRLAEFSCYVLREKLSYHE